MTTKVLALVLAAGQGTRMKSATPKVLHPVAGRPLLEHVLHAVQSLKPQGIGVVLGHGREQVRQALIERGWKHLTFIVQKQPRGSGHAVLQARPWLNAKKGNLLVVYGDTPLLTAATLSALVQQHAASGHAATFLAMEMRDPTGYGRMLTDGDGLLERIVEHKDAMPEERAVTLVNSGVACWDVKRLREVLPEIKPNNAKHEYYLTDAVALLRRRGEKVGVVTAGDPLETQGVNTRVELAQAEAAFRKQILEHWMREGVTIIDPATTYIDREAVIKADTRIWPGTMIHGASQIGAHCEIGPYTVVEQSVIKDGARVGPFSRVRPGSVIEQNAHIGNFVEIKKSTVGHGSKVNHLSYVGDTRMGSRVNIGAGTITCNYDGFSKYQTWIGDEVFVGSNANLVAPVRVGSGAIIAAGSTVTENIRPGALAVARSRQVNKEGWAKQFRNKHGKQSKGRKHA